MKICCLWIPIRKKPHGFKWSGKDFVPRHVTSHYSHPFSDRCLLNAFFFSFKKSSSSEHSTIPFVGSVRLKSNLNLSSSFHYFLSWFYEYEQQSPLLKTAFSVSISCPIPFDLGMTNSHNLHQAHGSMMWRSTTVLDMGVIRPSGHTSWKPAESVEPRKMISWTLTMTHHPYGQFTATA